MDKELLEQFQMIMDNMATKADMESMEERMTRKMEESELRIKIKIENEVTKKIETLFDGYKLAHEKQWELERRMEALEREFAELKGRIA